ncbi:MAG: hypothetical protein QXF26_05915 [Candidatus Bathyarchaeia archaeon]
MKLSWMRGTHTFASLVARFLRRFSAFRGVDNPNYGITIPKKMRRLWQLIEFTSMLPILLARFILPSFLGYTVIGERYAPDFIVWIILTSRDKQFLNTLDAKFLLALAARTQKSMFVTAKYTTLKKRRSDTYPAFLIEQLKLYRYLAKTLNTLILDTTSMTVEESTQTILRLINTKNLQKK